MTFKRKKVLSLRRFGICFALHCLTKSLRLNHPVDIIKKQKVLKNFVGFKTNMYPGKKRPNKGMKIKKTTEKLKICERDIFT